MKVKMCSNTQIYIQLLEEGTVCFRPTLAKNLGHNLYQIMPTSDYDPENEVWEFKPESIVRCEKRRLNEGEFLVAVSIEQKENMPLS